jgi:hypothetical protein
VANTLKIILKVTEQGFKNLDELIAKLGELADVIKDLGNIDKELNKIGDTVNDIGSTVGAVSKSIVKEGTQIAEGTVGRLLNELDTGLETLLARSLAFVGVIGLLGEATKAAVGGTPNLLLSIGTAFEQIQGVATSFFVNLFVNTERAVEIWNLLGQGIFNFNLILQTTLGTLFTFGTGVASFLTFNFLLKEAGILLRRILGRGTSNLSVLERATRLVFLFDDGLNRSFNTFGKFIKIGAFGIISFFNPLIGGIPLINSLIDVFGARVKTARQIVGRFFGDSTSAFQLAFQGIRQFLTIGLPGLINTQAVLKQVAGNSQEAAKEVQKLNIQGKAFSDLQILKTAKLPITAQIPLLRAELREIFVELNTSLNRVFLILSKVFSLTVEEIATIDKQAKALSDKTRKNITESTALLENVFAGGKLRQGLKDAGIQSEGFFTRIAKGIKAVALFDLTKILTVPIGGAINKTRDFIKRLREAPTIAESLKKAFTAVGSIISKSVTFRAARLGARALLATVRLIRGKGVTQAQAGEPEQRRLSATKAINTALGETKNKLQIATAEGNKILKVFLRVDQAILGVAKGVALIPQIGLVKPFNAVAAVVKELKAKTLIDDLNKSVQASDKIEKELKEDSKELQKLTGLAQQFQQTVKNVNTATQGTSAAIVTTVKETKLLDTAEKVVVENVKKTNQELTKTQSLLAGIIKDAFTIQKASEQIAKTGGRTSPAGGVFGIGRGAGGQFEDFVKNLLLLTTKAGNIDRINNTINVFLRAIGQIVNIVKPELKDRLSELFKVLETTKFKPPKDLQAFTKEIQKFFKAFKVPENITIENASKAATGFVKELRKQFESGKNLKEVEQGVLALIEIMISLLPSSPAKRGPLRRLPQMGAQVAVLFGQGIRSGKKVAGKAAGEMAQEVANYFPSSLPKLGALRKLLRAGFLIPRLLAQGIQKGIGALQSVMQVITDLIMKPIEEAANLSFVSERLGIAVENLSALDFALKTVGGGVQDVEFIIQRFNKVLAGTFTDDQARKFHRLGINLGEIQQANEPNIALLLEFSKILKKLPADSKGFQDALELLGTTANSKLINVLRQGPEVFQDLLKQGVKVGGTISKQFADNARKATELFNRLRAIRDKIFNDLINAVLPEINKRSNQLLALLDKFHPTIKTVLNLAVNGFGILARLAGAFFKQLFEQPQQTISIVFQVFVSLGKLVFNLIGDLFKKLGPHILNLIGVLGSLIFNAFAELMKGLFFNLALLVAKGANALISKFIETIVSAIDAIDPAALAVLETFVPGFEAGENALRSFSRTLRRNASIIQSNFKSVTDIIKDAVEENKGAFDELTQAGIDLAQNMFDPANVDILKGNLQNTINEIQGILQGTKFEPFVQELQKLFSAGQFQEIKRRFEEMREVALKNIGDIGEKAGNVADDIAKKVATSNEKTEAAVTKATNNILNILDKLRLETLSIDDDKVLRLRLNQEIQTRDFENAQLDRLQKLREFGATEAQIEEAKLLFKQGLREREAAAEEELEKLTLATITKTLQMFGTIFSTSEQLFSDLFELSGKKAKEFFIAQKAASIASAIINTAQGITKALALGGPLGIAQGAIVAAAGTVQIAKIIAQSFKTGGTVPGTGTGDKTIIAAEPGEKIIQNPAVSKYGGHVFDALNRMMLPSESVNALFRGFRNLPVHAPASLRFQRGETVPRVPQEAIQRQGEQEQPQTINVLDPSIVGQFMAQSDGRRTLINIMSDEREAIKGIVTS